MPHYKNGEVAQVGDKVKGKPYNTPHEVDGRIIKITSEGEECNCIVAFAELKEDYGAIKDFEKIV